MTSKQAMIYTGKYTTFTREEILAEVAAQMSEKRMDHVLRVEATALELAEIYKADLEKVSLAALLHDYAKDQPKGEMLDVIISENLDLDLTQYGSPVWHGPVGAHLARREFDVEDEEILEAIQTHTIAAPEMSQVAQIIYVADYIEPARDFEGVEKVRELAYESLEEAVKVEIHGTMKHLISQKKKIYPKALDSYNAWVVK